MNSPSDRERAAGQLDDAKRLLAELETHKAEIDLQNEELRASQDDLQAARDRFAELYEDAPVGYVVLDASGIVRRANRTWYALLNREEEDLRGTAFAETIVPEDAPLFRSRFRAFFRNPADKRIAVRMLRRGAAPFHARIEARLRPERTVREGDAPPGAELMMTVSDISELQQARERAERLNGILRAIRNVNQLITKEDDPRRLVEGACANLTENLSYRNAWIALLDGDGNVAATARAGLDGPFDRLREQLNDGSWASCMRRALGEDRLVVVEDPPSECAGYPLAEAYGGWSRFARRLAFDDRTYGVLAASVPTDYADNEEEQALFGEIADDLGFALHNMEMAERARQDRQRMGFVIEGARLGTWEWNLQTGEAVFNGNWAAMLGYTLGELAPVGIETWRELTHPGDLQRAEALLAPCVAGETPDYECELRMRHKDGHWVWILDRGRVMTHDEQGRPLLMYGTHTDIGEIKQAERLVESFFDEPMNLHLIAGIDGTIRRVNKAWETTLGHAPGDLVGKAFLELVHPDDVAATLECMEKLSVGKPVLDFENRYRHRDGGYRTLVWSASFDENGDMVLAVATDITERKRAEEALKASELRFQGILRNVATVSVQGYAIDGTVRYWNRASETLYGYSEKEALGRNLLDLIIPPEMREDVKAEIRRMAKTGEPLPAAELELMRKDGSRVPVYSSHALVDVPGRGRELFCIDIDLTERKRAEEALRKSEERFRSFFTNLTAGSCLDEIVYEDGRAVDYRILDVNPAYEAIIGLSRERVAGALGSQTYGLDEAPFLDRLEEVARTGVPVHFEAFFAPAGKHLDFTVSRPQPGMFSTVFFDITERKRAEEALEGSRREVQAIYDAAPIMLCVVDRERRVLYANSAFAAFVGASEESVRGGIACGALGCAMASDSPGGCGCGPECADCALLAALEDTLATGAGHTGIERRLTIERDGKRQEVAFLGATAAIRGETGTHALLCLADVTENWRMQQQLMQAQKLESVGRLAGGVAHDFNNMLQAILGNAEMILDDAAEDGPLGEKIGEIIGAARHAADLTRQLLVFARKQIVSPKVLDLNAAVVEMLNMLRRLIGENIELQWVQSEGLWPVKLDPVQFGMVLTNLCVNARDAIGGNGSVVIECRNATLDNADCPPHADAGPGEYVVLTVRDNGRGMDAETLAKVFEPFFTTKEVGQGTGLGLPTVQGVAAQNGGFVDVQSEVGKGTTFRVYFPRCPEGVAAAEPHRAAPPPMPRGTETVLLVEDSPDILKVGTTLLGRLGYRVLAAQSPKEALRLAEDEKGPIHLLVTDVVMPEMNGISLAQRIRETRPGIACLYMSGYTADAIAQHGIVEEGVDFLQKPFSNRALAEKVRDILDRPATA